MISNCGQLGVDYRRFDDRATFPGLCSAKTSSELVTDAKRASYEMISLLFSYDVLGILVPLQHESTHQWPFSPNSKRET